MAYNLTNITNATNFGDLVNNVNSSTGGYFGGGLLFLVYIITFSLSKNYDTFVAHLVASFSSTFIGGLLFFMGWIAWEIAVIPLILLVAMVITYYFRS